jgi:hypothetical protein
MAYLKPLPVCRYDMCQRSPSVELFDRYNDSHGAFCQKHGTVKLRELKKREERDDQATSRRSASPP